MISHSHLSLQASIEHFLSLLCQTLVDEEGNKPVKSFATLNLYSVVMEHARHSQIDESNSLESGYCLELNWIFVQANAAVSRIEQEKQIGTVRAVVAKENMKPVEVMTTTETFGWTPPEAKLHMVSDYFSESEWKVIVEVLGSNPRHISEIYTLKQSSYYVQDSAPNAFRDAGLLGMRVWWLQVWQGTCNKWGNMSKTILMMHYTHTEDNPNSM
ncbi:hypothetical protein IFM89_005096 [Coptis chinensis]|uniref:Uncharacterized protein n=1 Tax=Coptis chinensis TaxID=261450 RepID=A0A835IMR1_9MAGN|nr:hypothetical protein IFM89_005096 [Coptis chinensis]